MYCWCIITNYTASYVVIKMIKTFTDVLKYLGYCLYFLDN